MDDNSAIPLYDPTCGERLEDLLDHWVAGDPDAQSIIRDFGTPAREVRDHLICLYNLGAAEFRYAVVDGQCVFGVTLIDLKNGNHRRQA